MKFLSQKMLVESYRCNIESSEVPKQPKSVVMDYKVISLPITRTLGLRNQD